MQPIDQLQMRLIHRLVFHLLAMRDLIHLLFRKLLRTEHTHKQFVVLAIHIAAHPFQRKRGSKLIDQHIIPHPQVIVHIIDHRAIQVKKKCFRSHIKS